VIIATGASPQPPPFDVSRLSPALAVHHAWEVLRKPALVRAGARVTIVGGGMVGLETADLLIARQCTVTVIEMLAAVAQGMARNNRMELIDRLNAAGVVIHLETRIVDAHDTVLEVRGKDGSVRSLSCGDILILANGPKANRQAVAMVEAAGSPYTLIGDCSKPGDFLSGLRDAWLVGLGIEHFTRAGTRPESVIGSHV